MCLIYVSQLLYHSQVFETLQAVQGEIEELAVAAEGEYRFVGVTMLRLDIYHYII